MIGRHTLDYLQTLPLIKGGPKLGIQYINKKQLLYTYFWPILYNLCRSEWYENCERWIGTLV